MIEQGKIELTERKRMTEERKRQSKEVGEIQEAASKSQTREALTKRVSERADRDPKVR